MLLKRTKNVASKTHHVPKEGNNYSAALLGVADTAHSIRGKGKAMSIRARKEKAPKGKEWDEDKVEELYPGVAKYYVSVK